MRNSVIAGVLVVTAIAAGEYKKALPGYEYAFPRDYFNHEEFRTEWWYYTGNLRDASGRRFGYELTFFRHNIDRSKPENVWHIDDVWFAHFAMSDIEGRRFLHTERFNRAGAGLAGAGSGRIWNGNWNVNWQLDPSSPAGFASKRLRAVADGFRIDVTLSSYKPPVTHGRNGVSQKSAGAGRASHYISLTRLHTTGTLEIASKEYRVEGSSWMDHEFFTHSLEANQSGWDWFSLQLDDGSELMLYRLRRKDGSVEPYSSGTWVDEKGRARHLRLEEFQLEPGRTWTSPKTNAVYPVSWRVSVPSLNLDVTVTTPLDNQELVGKSKTSPVYWEGAVDVRGTHTGRGYVEMTGYAGALRMGE
jgi:predicted secreted hydrolase